MTRPSLVRGVGLLLALLVAACGDPAGTGADRSTGQVTISLGGARGARTAAALGPGLPAEVDRIGITCTAADMVPVTGDLPLDGSPLVLTIPAGANRRFAADAWAGAVHRLAGSTVLAHLNPGESTTVSIRIEELGAITFAAPPPTRVAVGQSVTLAPDLSGFENPAVVWSVNGVPGGNAAVGTITAAGLYTAPAAVPTPASVTIRVASALAPDLYAEAEVTITAASPVTVVVAPGAPRVLAGETVSLFASVASAADPSVTWAVDGIPGGNGTVGTITADGVYTAPPGPRSVTVTATSAADPAATGAVTVAVVDLAGAGLRASYSTGPDLVEGPIVHGWNAACADVGNNEYQGVCTPAAASPVDWAWGNGFDVTWTGWVHAPAGGAYDFRSNGWVDGIVYVEVDGVVVADLDTTGAGYSGVVTLAEGARVPVTLRFAPNGGSNNMRFFWIPPGAAIHAVPRAYLEPGAGGGDTLPPTAVLDGPEPVAHGADFTLSGARSSDAGGGSIVTYRWTAVDASGGGLTQGVAVETATPTLTVSAGTTPVPLGSQTYRLVVVDDSGNASAAVEVEVVVQDREAPTAAASRPGGTYAPFSLSLTAADDTDPAPRLYYTFDDRPQGLDWFRYQTAIYLLSGTQTIRFFAADAAGNWSAVQSETYVIQEVVVGVTIVPGAPRAVAGQTAQLAATVTSTANTAVTWAVNGIVGGNGTVGTIDAAGLYAAPATPPDPATVTVTAASAAAPAAADQVSLTVVDPRLAGLGARYSTGTVAVEGPIEHGWDWDCTSTNYNRYQGQCTPVAETPVNWASDSGFDAAWSGFLHVPAGGQITFADWVDGEVYVEVNGTVVADLNTVGGSYGAAVDLAEGARVPVTLRFRANGGSNNMGFRWRLPGATAEYVPAAYLEPAVAVAVTPVTAVVAAGGSQLFGAEVIGSVDPTVAWSVEDVSCGAGAGSVDGAGLYRAGNPGSDCQIAVRATSVADPTASATAAVTVTAAPAAETWVRTFGGTARDAAGVVRTTPDGGYVLGGWTASYGAGAEDAWVVKLASDGGVQWQHGYGFPGSEDAHDVIPTADGGYLVAGGTRDAGAGFQDPWLLKLDAAGAIQWQRTYGRANSDYVLSLQQAADNGYVLAGATYTSPAGDTDAWVLKLDAAGGIQWQNTYGAPGTNLEWAYSVRQTADGSYIVGGQTNAFGVAGTNNLWVLKLDAAGAVTWERTYGPGVAYAVRETADGGYVVAGSDIPAGANAVLRLDSAGNLLWARSYALAGTSGSLYAVETTPGGGFILAGQRYLADAGTYHGWLLQLDGAGGIVWQRLLGEGVGENRFQSVLPTADGGTLAVGSLWTGDNDQYQAWIVKLDGNGQTAGGCGTVPGHDAVAVTPALTPVASAAAVGPATGVSVAPTLVAAASTGAILEAPCGVLPAFSVSLDFTTATLATGEALQFTATVSGTGDARVTWLVDGIPGGDASTVGTVDASGLYTAPASAPEPATVTITAVSVADPSASVSATVTILGPPGGSGWSRAYTGGTGYDRTNGVVPTADGGTLAVGFGSSFQGPGWVLRLDPVGNIAWQRTYGGHEAVTPNAVLSTAAGGYILAGSLQTLSGPASRGSEFWVAEIDAEGTLLWETAFGASSVDAANAIQPAGDGGYFLAGYGYYWDTGEGSDFAVVKVDAGGALLWQRHFGGTADETAYGLLATDDGGCLAVGQTYSFGAGDLDIWVLKLAADGSVEWQKTYGGANGDRATSVVARPEGGYLIGGESSSFGAGGRDWLLLAVDGAGDVEWARAYGGAQDESAPQLVATAEGYALGGTTRSFGAGSAEAALVGVDPSGALLWQQTYGASGADYLNSLAVNADQSLVFGGYSASFRLSASNNSMWVVNAAADGSLVDGCALVRTPSFSALDVAAQVVAADTFVAGADAGFVAHATDSTSRPTAVEPITQCSGPGVTVHPEELTLAAGATFPFRALEVGTGGDSVTWDASAGAIDADGIYQAPGAVPNPSQVSVTAVSDAVPSAAGSATVEVVSSTPRWARTLGGPQQDVAHAVRQTADGGYVAAGYTRSFGAGNDDAWVVKFDADGGVQWQQAFGGPSNDRAYAVAESASGGYLAVGYTYSFGAGYTDFWVLRLGPDGALLWARTYGEADEERAYSVLATADGGWLVGGQRIDPDSGNYDGWLIKLDDAGAVLQQETLGASGGDELRALEPTADGGYVALGTKTIIPGGYANSNPDVWVIQLDSALGVQWQTTLGRTTEQLTPQYGYAIQQIADGGYILAGSDYFGSEQYTDFWVVRLDAAGGIVWQHTYGRPVYGSPEEAYGVRQTADGGFVVAGTAGINGELGGGAGSGYASGWLLKLDASGDVLWQRAYGGATGYDTALYALDLTSDGGLVLAGSTRHRVGMGTDAWLLRLDADGEVAPDCAYVDTVAYVAGSTAYTASNTAYSVANTAVAGADSALSVTDTAASPAVQCVAGGP